MEQNKTSSYLKHDLITLGVLAVIAAGLLGGLAYWEYNNGGFSKLATSILATLGR